MNNSRSSLSSGSSSARKSPRIPKGKKQTQIVYLKTIISIKIYLNILLNIDLIPLNGLALRQKVVVC